MHQDANAADITTGSYVAMPYRLQLM